MLDFYAIFTCTVCATTFKILQEGFVTCHPIDKWLRILWVFCVVRFTKLELYARCWISTHHTAYLALSVNSMGSHLVPLVDITTMEKVIHHAYQPIHSLFLSEFYGYLGGLVDIIKLLHCKMLVYHSPTHNPNVFQRIQPLLVQIEN